jgi:lambda repressor-like predicted transcriptional regulator
MKRKPGRYLSCAEVRRRCAAAGRAAICGGQVIVLIALLEKTGWTVVRLARRSGVSRQFLGAVLTLKKFPTTDRWWRVARAFGMKLHVFDDLAEHAVGA